MPVPPESPQATRGVRRVVDAGDVGEDDFATAIPLLAPGAADNDGLDIEAVRKEYYGPRRSPAQWRVDLLLMALEYLQVYSVILVLAERFPWPEEWVTNVRFMHLFNGDYYAFKRIGCCWGGTKLPIPSADVGLSYTGYAVGWALVPSAAIAAYFVAFAVYRRRATVTMMLDIARAQRILLAFCQVVYLPVGIAFSRLFQCSDGTLVVDNSVKCWTPAHATMAAPLLVIGILMLIALPVFVGDRVRRQIIHASADTHERHLRQKEKEYTQRADHAWALFGMYLFSSYRRQSAYFKVFSLCYRLAIVGLMSFLYAHINYNTGLLLLVLSAHAAAITVRPPYRLRSFALAHILLAWFNVLTCLLGYLVVLRTLSPLLVKEPLRWELLLLFIAGVFVVLGLAVYSVLKTRGIGLSSPLWPSGNRPEFDMLPPTQRRSVALVIEGRQLLESAYRTPAALVPTHDLADLIERVNATFEQALAEGDPIAESLRDLLDELVNAHNAAVPFSMYADSKKKSVSKTAKELQELMPGFRKRLDRRDYDLILAD
eukprot:Opistho-1_new@8487